MYPYYPFPLSRILIGAEHFSMGTNKRIDSVHKWARAIKVQYRA